jgi:hypothetical protein
MSTNNGTTQINARVSGTQKKAYQEASEQLGLSSLSALMTSTLDAVAGQVVEEGWRCQTVYVQGTEIIGYGPHRPMSDRNVPVPCASFQIVAPDTFWARLRRELG